jgi:hypothetical protein
MRTLTRTVCLLALLCAVQGIGTCQFGGGTPYFPVDRHPTWQYTVRLSMYAHDPIWDPTAPMRWHELSIAEIRFLGEDYTQTVRVLRYGPPNPVNDTVWGLWHYELGFVLWMRQVPAVRQGSEIPWASFSQIGETAKDVYNPFLTPRQNDALGNIQWFKVSGMWYPRTWIRYPNWVGQRWTELWGPFDHTLLSRSYTNSYVTVVLNRRFYKALQVKIVGPSEGDPNAVTTEIYKFVDGIGMYSRYLDVTNGPGGTPPNTMVFKHIATLNSVSFH